MSVENRMQGNAATVLTLANGKGVDLLNVRVEDIDFAAIAEHLAKEKRFNGATPNVEYSVAQHLSIGSDSILAAGGTETEAAYFLLHDAQEAIWKDDPTPKKVAIAVRVAEKCGVVASDILAVLAGIVAEHDAAIHEAAGLPWPVPGDISHVVKRYDAIMFVTEWRDLMGNVAHPNWGAYGSLTPLSAPIRAESWPHARAGWLYRAKRLLPALQAKRFTPERERYEGASAEQLREQTNSYLDPHSEAATRRSKPTPERPELERLLHQAKEWFNSLSPEQQEAHLREQRASWVRGEMGLDREPQKLAHDKTRSEQGGN